MDFKDHGKKWYFHCEIDRMQSALQKPPPSREPLGKYLLRRHSRAAQVLGQRLRHRLEARRQHRGARGGSGQRGGVLVEPAVEGADALGGLRVAHAAEVWRGFVGAHVSFFTMRGMEVEASTYAQKEAVDRKRMILTYLLPL